MADITCPQCKALNRSNARFCVECGALLGGTSQSAVPSSAQNQRIGKSAVGADSQSPSTTTPTGTELQPPPSQTGKVLLNRYRIENELGRGGFGAVYKAWDANLNRYCAVKENLETSAEAQRQFTREATVLANLSHPNLPRVIDHFSIPGRGQYLVMDFVEGEDLDTRMHRGGLPPVEQSLVWICQVADALTYLHSRQPPVLHRDIKPSNIRITPEGQAMLVDFGLVKLQDPRMQTTMGARAVTPGYAPPEQYGKGRTDARTDVYALGATSYKLLTGRDPAESVQRVAGGGMPSTSQLNPRVPLHVSQAIEKAMALDPVQRFQSAAQFKEMLAFPSSAARDGRDGDHLVARIGTAGAQPAQGAIGGRQGGSLSIPHSDTADKPSRKTPWLWIILGSAIVVGLLCLVIGGGLLAMWGGGGSDADATLTAEAYLGISASPAFPSPTFPSPVATSTPPGPTPTPAYRSKDPTTFVYAGQAEPDTLDTGFNYETAGLEVIQNVYDTLIFYKRENPSEFVPQLALEVPSEENGGISPDGLVYTFKIRPGVLFHDGSSLSAEDVAYTFQRNILQGGSASPQWLFTEPIFGVSVYDVAALVDPALVDRPADLVKADAGKLQEVCQRLTAAISADNAANTVTFHLAQPWAPFLATLANGWGGIRSKAWTISNGGWDGNCSTWQNYYGKTSQELNKTLLGTGEMGTGPYILDHWTSGEEIVLKANEFYWRTEPAWEGGPVGVPALKTVIILFRFEPDKRFPLLESGEADAVDMDSISEWPNLDNLTGQICHLTDQDCQPTSNPDGPLELIRGYPTASRSNDIFFNWSINTEGGNNLIGSGRLDGAGIPPDFFSNVHVRKAFSYCFNYNTYLDDVLQGEGIRSFDVMLPGMIGYDSNSPYYPYNLSQCEAEFRQAEFSGANVWTTGFSLKLPYNNGNTTRQKIAENLAHELTSVNTQFKVEVVGLDGSDYGQLEADYKLPFYTTSWVEDIHDPHNWVMPWTIGTLGRQQALPQDLQSQFQEIINRGVIETDPARRAAIYSEFNQLYFEQAPGILLYQALGRHYEQRWVKGWYNNPIFPGNYFYVLAKD